MSSSQRCVVYLGLACVLVGSPASGKEPLRFNRDIRPILSDKCFACHGPAAQEDGTELRLDLRESAVNEWESIVPGKPDDSELIRRIHSTDQSEQMPPPEIHKPLTNAERKLLARWITEGAEYEPHWSYTSLDRPAVPAAEREASTIDRFTRHS